MKKKILIIQNKLMHYRIDVFNHLNKYYDITVAYSETPNDLSKIYFNTIELPSYKIYKFTFQAGLVGLLKSNNFDVIITMFDLWWPNTILVPFLYSKHKLVYWGHRYSRSKFACFLRNVLIKRAKAVLLYSDHDIKKMLKSKIVGEKIFVANNTVNIKNHGITFSNSNKKYFLYVGRAQKRKRIDLLIEAYYKSGLARRGVDLMIVGSGQHNEELKELSRALDLSSSVKFLGEITDAAELKEIFSNAIAYVSPGPVGLGVLHSFAYGVPVVTKRRCMHGPEFNNIINNFNGVIYDEDDDLCGVLCKLSEDEKFLKNISINAYRTYEKNSISEMLSGFSDAIQYAVINN